MADKFFKIAAILTAVDQMSAVFASATRKSMAEMDKMQKQMQTMRNASLMIGAGEKSIGFVKQFVDSSADMEEAGNKLKAVLMDKNGVYNADTYNQIEGLSQKLSNVYAQSAMDYLDAARVFKQNRIEPKDILGGVLESTAKLADYFDQMNPGQVALFASRMKNDFGVAANEMGSMMDLLARLKDSGVGGFNGSVAVEQMTQFFGKASLGMANMKNVGLQAAKELGTVGGYFISRGLSPETVGTNIRRIYDTLRNPERLGQMMQAAQKMAGVQLRFFGNDKQFLGMANFVQELGKLKGLDVQTIDSILSKPFGGKMGLSSEMATFLALNGTEKFKEFSDSIENQATLSQKLSEIMNGWNYVVKVIKSSFETLKQMFGKGLLPFLKEAGNALNEMIVRLQQFGSEYPRIAKFGLMFAGLGGLALIFGGIGSAIGVVISGLKFLGIGISGILRFIPQVALLAAIFSNLDTDIIQIQGHMYTLGEILWNVVLKPIETLAGMLEQLVKPFQFWREGWGQTGYYDRKNNYWLNRVDTIDERFSNNQKVLTPLPTAGTGQYVFTNHITVNGTNPLVGEQVGKAVSDTQRDFARLIKEYDAQKRRKQF